MLQRQMLQRFAPTSLALIYFPIDTGSPGHDISEHLSRFSAHRIDLEETQLIGGRVIGHVEYDLGPADEAEMQSRIATIPYAERKFKSNSNAVEFVRVIKECAGDADPRSIQIWASWAYEKLQEGINAYNPTSDLTPEEHYARVVTDVLTQLGRMAMELTAVTATNEEHLLDDPEVYEYFGAQHCYTDGDDAKERENLFELRCRELLDRQDTTNPFTAELNFIKSKISHSQTSSIRLSDSEIYQSHLADDGLTGEALEAMVEDFERITEQYTEDGAISLHMSDGERFVVDGTIDDDVDSDYLPQQVAAIIPELKNLFVEGVPLNPDNPHEYSIQRFIDGQLDLIYGNRGDDDYRSVRTVRTTAYLPTELRSVVAAIEAFAAITREELADLSTRTRHSQVKAAVHQFAKAQLRNPALQDLPFSTKQLAQFKAMILRMLPAIAKDTLTVQYGLVYEFEERRDVYVNADERRYAEDVISQIIQNLSRDFVLSAKRQSKLFRSYADAIERWTDTRKLIECIQQAYEARRKGSLNIKQFTALDTLYQARRAALETAPLVRPASLDRKYRSQKIGHITTNISRNLLRSKTNHATFRSWVTAIDQANDSLTLTLAVNLARQDRSRSRLSAQDLEQIVSLYETKSILLDTPTLNGELPENRSVNVSINLIYNILALNDDGLNQFATQLHGMPLQEKERVRTALRKLQPERYRGIKSELLQNIKSASTKKLMYLRFAFYEDPKTGAPNQPHNRIHLLTQGDRAEIWEVLKARTGLPQPTQS